jgi:hypothetical protein
MQPTDWFEQDIRRIMDAINKHPTPTHPVKVGPCETVIDHVKFIEGHLSMIRNLSNPQLQLPYVLRLEQYCKTLEQ